MFNQSVWSKVDTFQSVPSYSLTSRSIHACHDKFKLHAVIFNGTVLRDFLVSIGEAGKKVNHHSVNGIAATVFTEVNRVIRSIAGK